MQELLYFHANISFSTFKIWAQIKQIRIQWFLIIELDIQLIRASPPYLFSLCNIEFSSGHLHGYTSSLWLRHPSYSCQLEIEISTWQHGTNLSALISCFSQLPHSLGTVNFPAGCKLVFSLLKYATTLRHCYPSYIRKLTVLFFLFTSHRMISMETTIFLFLLVHYL